MIIVRMRIIINKISIKTLYISLSSYFSVIYELYYRLFIDYIMRTKLILKNRQILIMPRANKILELV